MDFSTSVFVFVVAMWVEVVKGCLQEEAPQMWKLMLVNQGGFVECFGNIHTTQENLAVAP